MKATSTLAFELSVAGQTTRFESSESSIVIGRSKSCTVTIPKNDVVSREHLKVEQKEGDIWLTDLGSSNGTYYRGSKLVPHVECLYTGDTFYLGSKADGYGMKITYATSEVAKPTAPEESPPIERTVALQTSSILAFRDDDMRVQLDLPKGQTQASIQRPVDKRSATQVSMPVPPQMKESTRAAIARPAAKKIRRRSSRRKSSILLSVMNI